MSSIGTNKYDKKKILLRKLISEKVDLISEKCKLEDRFEPFFEKLCKSQQIKVTLTKNIYESLNVVLSKLANIECLSPYKDLKKPAQYFINRKFDVFQPYLEGMKIEPDEERAKRYKFTINGKTYTQNSHGVFEGIYKDGSGKDIRAAKQNIQQKIEEEKHKVEILKETEAGVIPPEILNEFNAKGKSEESTSEAPVQTTETTLDEEESSYENFFDDYNNF